MLATGRFVPSVVVGLALVFSGSAHAHPESHGSVAPKGNATGVALLTQVEHAYAKYGGAELDLGEVRIVYALRSDVVVGMELLSGPAAVRVIEVGTSNSVSYERLGPSSKCWIRIKPSSRLVLDKMNDRFPDIYDEITLGAPQTTKRGWTLAITNPAPKSHAAAGGGTGEHARTSYFVIDRRSELLRSILLAGLKSKAYDTETVRALRATPKLPDPIPVCSSP